MIDGVLIMIIWATKQKEWKLNIRVAIMLNVYDFVQMVKVGNVEKII